MTAAHDLLQLCRRHFDPRAEPVTTHAGHNQTTALRATTRAGEVIIKIHRNPQRHNQERAAYRHWAPALGERVPQLLVEIDDPPAIIVTALPGTPLAELALPPQTERNAFGHAGALLAAWHRAGPARPATDTAVWLATRGEQWLELATTILSPAQRADIRAHLRELAGLGPQPAVPCHLDD